MNLLLLCCHPSHPSCNVIVNLKKLLARHTKTHSAQCVKVLSNWDCKQYKLNAQHYEKNKHMLRRPNNSSLETKLPQKAVNMDKN